MPASSRSRGRTPAVALAGLALTAGLVQLGRATWGVSTAMGAPRRRIEPEVIGSPRYDDGTFHNTLPGSTMTPGSGVALLRALLTRGDRGKPKGDVPLRPVPDLVDAAEAAVTWLGHASALIELDGHWVLADPVWSERVSPSSTVGPQRLHPVPMDIDRLPRLTAVIISHDHYDHLDLPTVRALVDTQTAPFVVPMGIGAHLRTWGVPDTRIVELDWNGSTTIESDPTGSKTTESRTAGGLTLTCTEARHFSGRGLRRDVTLWSSWALAGPRHRVFFGGDTGYTPAFAEIGARLGPFDLTLLPIGAYGDQWPDIHMNPEQAWRAHGDLGGRLLVPIHWATFDLAFHAWAEPVERLLATADAGTVAVPPPGGRVVADGEPATVERWWTGL